MIMNRDARELFKQADQLIRKLQRATEKNRKRILKLQKRRAF
jgi:acyl-ACP thioesterase